MNIFTFALLAAGAANAHNCGVCSIDIQVCTSCKAEAKPCPVACTPSCTPCSAPIAVATAPVHKPHKPICKRVPIEKRGLIATLLRRPKKEIEVCTETDGSVTVYQPAIAPQYNPCTGNCSIPTAAPVKVVQPVVYQTPKPVVTCTSHCQSVQPCNPCSSIVIH